MDRSGDAGMMKHTVLGWFGTSSGIRKLEEVVCWGKRVQPADGKGAEEQAVVDWVSLCWAGALEM